jgi:hypothetical protein
MIFASQPNWSIIQHAPRHAPDGEPLHFFTWPVIAWRHEKGALIPMTFEALNHDDVVAVLGPDGKVSIDGAVRIDRVEYERRVIASDPRAKAELSRRAAVKRELEPTPSLRPWQSAGPRNQTNPTARQMSRRWRAPFEDAKPQGIVL